MERVVPAEILLTCNFRCPHWTDQDGEEYICKLTMKEVHRDDFIDTFPEFCPLVQIGNEFDIEVNNVVYNIKVTETRNFLMDGIDREMSRPDLFYTIYHRMSGLDPDYMISKLMELDRVMSNIMFKGI